MWSYSLFTDVFWFWVSGLAAIVGIMCEWRFGAGGLINDGITSVLHLRWFHDVFASIYSVSGWFTLFLIFHFCHLSMSGILWTIFLIKCRGHG